LRHWRSSARNVARTDSPNHVQLQRLPHTLTAGPVSARGLLDRRIVMPRLIGISIASVALLASAPEALACGATPEPYWTIASTLPRENGILPTDGALIVRAAPSPASSGGTPPITFTVSEEGSADSIAGVTEVWFSDTPSMSWHSLSPLKPSTSYQAMVRIDQQTLPTSSGPTDLTWKFSTSAQPTAPLALEGSLLVVTEDYQRDIQQCDTNDCGSFNCRVTGKEPAVRAKITLPIARGGYAIDGYRAWLHYSANNPQVFDGPGEGHPSGYSEVNLASLLTMHEGESQEVVVPLFEEADPYEPCFALNVVDPTDHAVHPEPKCIGAFKPSAAMKGTESGGHCAMSSGAPHRGATAMGYLGLVVLCGIRVSRRRARNG
jgi:hypothetical protein